jgi:hypothetical protein
LDLKLSAGPYWKNLALDGLPAGAEERFALRNKSFILKDFLQLAERVETDLGI